MPLIISHDLPAQISDRYRVVNSRNESRIMGLRDLNVFIGPNNSGKSILLRSLFSHSPTSNIEIEFGIEERPNVRKVYIPSLRGLRPIITEDQDFYETRTRNDLFSDAKGAFENGTQHKDI
jgi:AAA15 family ATPase/GTPase